MYYYQIMKKRCIILGILLIAILLTGCVQQETPELVCDDGYMRDGDGCCKDQNDNSECDEDEDTLFEPAYAPREVAIEDLEEPDYAEIEDETDDVQEPTIIDVPEEKVYVEPEKPEIDYEALARIDGMDWFAENEKMSIRITKMIIDVNTIKPRDRLSPDKEAILKEVHMEIKNKRYNYMNFELLFRVQDERDPLRIKKVLKCNSDDDFVMEGCRQGFREGDVLQIRMIVDEPIQKVDLEKNIRFILENIRDTGSWNAIELSKTVDILEIDGAEYI
jgi:hypothetical protein